MTSYLCLVAGRLDGVVSSLVVDDESGTVRRVGRTAVGPRPMPLVLGAGRRLVLVGNGGEEPRITTLAWDDDGSTRVLATASCPIAQTSLGLVGDLLLVVDYARGLLAVTRVGSDGRVDADGWQLSRVGVQPHCVAPAPDGRSVQVSLLGEDRLVGLRVVGGALVPAEELGARLDPGAGPRHLRFSPDGGSLYVTTELSGQLVRLRRDPASGQLAPGGAVSCVDPGAGLRPGVHVPPGRRPTAGETEGRIWVSDLAVAPDGGWVVVSERRASTLTMIALGADGALGERIAQLPTETQPRGIGLIGPRLVIAGAELGQSASIYRADAQGLRLLASVDGLGGPVWMESVPLD